METLSEAYREFYESECPIDAFPKVIRDVARTYSVGRNLPMELLCFCACGILSGAMGRVFKARNAVSGGYTQNANIFVLGVGESSTGKSASIRALFSSWKGEFWGKYPNSKGSLPSSKKQKLNACKTSLTEKTTSTLKTKFQTLPSRQRIQILS